MFARCGTPACTNVDIQPLGDGLPVRTGDYNALAFGDREHPFVTTKWENLTGVDVLMGVLGFDCSVAPCIDSQQTIYYQVPTPGGIGQDMAIGPDDMPVVSHVGYADNVLLFGRCQDADCAGAVGYVLLDSGNFALEFDDSTSIGVRPDGRAVIAYQRQSATVPTFTSLLVVECTDVNCVSHESVVIERSGDNLVTGIDADLAIDAEGAVAVAYFDQSALSLKLARCNVEGCDGPYDVLFADGFEDP
jgi:hypothetical protein